MEKNIDIIKEREQTKRDLGWRWVIVSCFALTFTAFVVGWVMVTQAQTNKDIEVQRIQSNQAIEVTKYTAKER